MGTTLSRRLCFVSEAFMIGGFVADIGFAFAFVVDSLAITAGAAGVGEPTPDAAMAGAIPVVMENAAAAGRGTPGGFATFSMISSTLPHLFAKSVPMSSRSPSDIWDVWKWYF